MVTCKVVSQCIFRIDDLTNWLLAHVYMYIFRHTKYPSSGSSLYISFPNINSHTRSNKDMSLPWPRVGYLLEIPECITYQPSHISYKSVITRFYLAQYCMTPVLTNSLCKQNCFAVCWKHKFCENNDVKTNYLFLYVNLLFIYIAWIFASFVSSCYS